MEIPKFLEVENAGRGEGHRSIAASRAYTSEA